MLNKVFMSYSGILITVAVLAFMIAFLLHVLCADMNVLPYNPAEWLTNFDQKSTCGKARDVLSMIAFIGFILIVVTLVVPWIVKGVNAYRAPIRA